MTEKKNKEDREHKESPLRPEKWKEYAEFLGYEEVDVDKLKVAPTNVRIDTDIDIKMLENSVKAVGIREAIVINDKYEIIKGQLRWMAAKRAGLKKVPCEKYRFKNRYIERITSIVDEACKYELTERDKYNFIRKAIEEDGKSFEEVSLDTGIAEITLRSWYNYGKVPEIVKQVEEKAKEDREIQKKLTEYKETSIKRKRLVDKALKHARNVDQAIQIIKHIDMPTRELAEIAKEVKEGLEVDIEKRKEIIERPHYLVRVRIPADIYRDFIDICRKEKVDAKEVILELIKQYIRQHSSV